MENVIFFFVVALAVIVGSIVLRVYLYRGRLRNEALIQYRAVREEQERERMYNSSPAPPVRPAVPSGDTMFCRHCGRPMAKTWKFCQECGQTQQ